MLDAGMIEATNRSLPHECHGACYCQITQAKVTEIHTAGGSGTRAECSIPAETVVSRRQRLLHQLPDAPSLKVVDDEFDALVRRGIGNREGDVGGLAKRIRVVARWMDVFSYLNVAPTLLDTYGQHGRITA